MAAAQRRRGLAKIDCHSLTPPGTNLPQFRGRELISLLLLIYPANGSTLCVAADRLAASCSTWIRACARRMASRRIASGTAITPAPAITRCSCSTLTRPVGRPPHSAEQDRLSARFHANFSYQAGTWTKPRRVIAKVEWHPAPRRLHRDEHELPGRARRCFLQQARDVRAMDQGGQKD